MASKAKATAITDHDEIRRWAEERGAKPACVRKTGDSKDVGILRLDFPGYSGEDSLETIEWDAWFEKFDEQGLALLHQETTAGGEKSNFNKLVSRETAQEANRGTKKNSSRKSTKASFANAKMKTAKSSATRTKSPGTRKTEPKKVEALATKRHSSTRKAA